MDLREKLSKRIGKKNILEIVNFTKGCEKNVKRLYNLLYDNDKTVSYQAAWAMCHFSQDENEMLYAKQDDMIDELFKCNHTGKRRLILNLLLKQPQANPPRLDFLDFCMERMFSGNEPYGIKSLCIKLGYELCRTNPDLLNVFKQTLELVDNNLLPMSMKSSRNMVLRKMGKKLQVTSKGMINKQQ